jgi:uncharacterized membrane protein
MAMNRAERRRQQAANADRPAETSRLRPEWVFGVIAMAGGLFMVFVTPPFQGPDETSHFYRAFQISEGHLVSQREGDRVGGLLPASVGEAAAPFAGIPRKPVTVDVASVKRTLAEPFLREPRQFIEFMHIALYSPVAYTGHVAGILVGRAADLSALKMMYLARLFGLVFWAGLVFAAIRLTPVHKWTMVTAGLLPMTVFLGACVSSDSATIGLAMLLAALVLRCCTEAPKPVAWRQWFWVVLLCVLVALAKQVYFVLALLALAVPRERFGSGRRKLLMCCVAFLAAAGAEALWAWATRGVFVTEEWVQPGQQISFIFGHPIQFMEVLARSVHVRGLTVVTGFVGVLGWMDTLLPTLVYAVCIAMLAAVAILDGRSDWVMSRYQRMVAGGVWLAAVCLIVLSQYVLWTPPGFEIVGGVQGRYLLPIAVPMLLVLYNRKVLVSQRVLAGLVGVLASLIMIVTCITVVQRYYA